MALRYDFYRNPAPGKDESEPRLHARVVTSGTISTEDIAGFISQSSSATRGDVELVVTQLVAETRKWLSRGYRVHIKGLGYLGLTLDAPPVHTPKEVRAESIRVKSVKLRPDMEMKKAIGSFHLAKAQVKNHSKRYASGEIEARLKQYFASHQSMSSDDFLRLFAFTRSTAMRRIRKLVEEGKLVKSGYRHLLLYLPGEL
ncbi:DNA-binding protein [Bacteroidia bacterium]|nr:DNA-binding protein [Bacteroidia bacterium]